MRSQSARPTTIAPTFPLSSLLNADDTMCMHQTCDLDSLPCDTGEHPMPIIVEAEIHR